MKKFFLFCAALLGMSSVFAQDLTYNVTVPAGTKACYIAGDMNSWSFTEMTKVDDTHYTITAGSGGYKYCSGPSWDYVEKDAQGEEISNRTYSESDVVASWKAVYDPETPTPAGDAYYIKNNWNSSGWTWQEMTPNEDKSEWTYTGVYGGTGVNINTKADDAGAQWFEQSNIQGTATVGAEVTFTYNVAAATVTAVSGDTPTPPTPGTNTYYLVGYINGVDYGISGDIDNMGDYNLTAGPVVITFTEKSYVQVKNQNKSIYGTAYVDATEPGSTVLSVGATDKIGLPANVEITFTLTENADGTVTLAYTWGDTPTPPTPGTSTYYLIGYINGADSGCEEDYESFHEEYKFVNGSLTTTFTVTSYVFVKTGDNNHWYLSENYVEPAKQVTAILANGMDYGEKVGVNANVEVTFTLTENADGTVTLSYTCGDTPTPPTPGEEGFGIILGDGSTVKGWKNEGQIEFLEYMIESDLTTGATFQLYDFGNQAAWTEQNIDEASTKNVIINASNVYEVLADGHYTIYLKMYGPENNQVYIGYTEPTSIREATIKAAVKKMVVDGIFYIVKDNKAYTAHGF